MDIKYTNEIIKSITPFLTENGFVLDGASFKKDSRAFSVKYEDAKKEFVLSAADIAEDGELGASAVLSTWFFDEADHGANDTKCIADDFTEVIAASIGVKLATAAINSQEVAMPEKNVAGTEPGIEAFTQKFLAMFPQYKDAYKAMVAKYNDFLYIEFYKTYGIEKMKELMANEAANKKAIAKYFTMLGDMQYEGELILGDIICSVILAGAFGNDPAAFEAAAEKYLADYPFLRSAGRAAVKNYKSNKKLRAILEA